MFGISPSEKCAIASAQWYDKGFLRIGFKAGSETLVCFINAYNEKIDDAKYAKVLQNVTKNLAYVFDLEYSGPQINRVEYLQWMAQELTEKVGSECRVKVGLSRAGNKFIIAPSYVFSPFIEKADGPSRLTYSEYEKNNYGPKEGLSFVSDDVEGEEQEIFIEDFNIPNF
jgi:hypothetical protein